MVRVCFLHDLIRDAMLTAVGDRFLFGDDSIPI